MSRPSVRSPQAGAPAAAGGAPASASASRAAEILAGQRRWLWPGMMHYYREPLVLEEGSGVWVRDVDGREYLDAFGGIITTSLGHCHPRVVEAVREQVGRLGHTSTLYVTEPQVEAAHRLAEIAPGGLDRTFFTNSGSEAVETAVALARAYTGRTDLIALRGCLPRAEQRCEHAHCARLLASARFDERGNHARARPVPVSLPVPSPL